MPTAIVTNDDGVFSEGLAALARHVEAAGFRVCVFAPAGPASGTGKGFRVPARIEEVDLGVGDCAYMVYSTPATSVYLGLHLLDWDVDVVVSGVNRGPNMGLEDILTSGTVGAAMEAAFHGVPGVAASLASDHPSPLEYHDAARPAAAAVAALARLAPGEPLVVNVNAPPRPRGVEATVPAWNNYMIRVVAEDGVAKPLSSGLGSRYWDRRPGTDVEAVLSGAASLSLLRLTPRGLDSAPLGDPLLEAIASYAGSPL